MEVYGNSTVTITRPSDRSSVTKSGKRDIETTPSEPNIKQLDKEVKNTEGLTCAEGGLSWPIHENVVSQPFKIPPYC